MPCGAGMCCVLGFMFYVVGGRDERSFVAHYGLACWKAL